MGLRNLRAACFATILAGTCLATGAQAQTQLITTIDQDNRLVTVNSSSPSTIVRTTNITGLGNGQQIVAFDARPAANGRIFYGISNTGQLYSINAISGSASAVGAPVALQGTSFGLDFNPTVDRIRLISNTGQNLRINPETGAVITDGNLNITIGGQPIVMTGNTAAAYTNNVAGATSTTLFVINSDTGLLQIQSPPNDGNLNTVVGGLGGDASGRVEGFDISGSGEARVSIVQDGVTRLYSVNLTTGQATLIGSFAGGDKRGLAYTAAAFGGQSGLNPNQTAVANTFDGFTSVAPGLIPFLTTLDGLTDAQRANAFTQLSPAGYGILPEVVLQAREAVDTTLRTYLHDFRSGGTARAGSDGGIGGFLVARGRTGRFEQSGDGADTRYRATGFMGGLDFRLSSNALLGVTAAYDMTDVRLSSISPDSSANTWSFGGYGTFAAGPLFLDLNASYGKTNFDLRRNMSFGTFASENSAESDARYFGATAIAGINHSAGGIDLEPYVGLRYANIRVDGFSEGTGLTNLTVDRQKLRSLQGVAGLRVGARFEGMGATIRPQVRAEYRHEFEDEGNRLISASFNGDGIDTPFLTDVGPLSDNHIAAGASVTVSSGGPLSFVVDYSGQLTGGYNIHALEVGVRIAM